MPKARSVYVCSNCGSQQPKWIGRCPNCSEWGTLEAKTIAARSRPAITGTPKAVEQLSEISEEAVERISTGIGEVDRVLGGGLVPGAFILFTGDPGIGKSTLVLEIAERLGVPTLYVSGEESGQQVKVRVKRLGLRLDRVGFLAETDLSTILATIEKEQPRFVILDSIQTLREPSLPREPGSVAQLKAIAAQLTELAKGKNVSVLLIGHVTKGGTAAGPKTLEHLVDTVLSLEGDPRSHYRILRALKNRFGSTNEVGVFEMTEGGLREVSNPSKIFLEQPKSDVPGMCVAAVLEGSRVFLLEIQALLNRVRFGYPQRKASGFDFNRLQLLLAVIGKRLGIPINNFDVHVNVVGGMRVTEPAADLAVCLAILSAFRNRPVQEATCVFGEVGLAGEIRSVSGVEKRVKEAAKLGFQHIVLPGSAEVEAKGVTLSRVQSLREAEESGLR